NSDANDIILIGSTITAGSITATGQGDVELTASGSIVDGAGKIAADVLTAISVGSQTLDTTISSLVATTSGAGFIAVTETDAITLTDVESGNGPISVTAGGDIIAVQVVSLANSDANDIALTGATITAGTITATGQGDVDLTASGSIIDGAGKITADVLTATSVASQTLDTTVSILVATTSGTGFIAVTETDAITLTDVESGNGLIAVTAGGDVVAVRVVSSTNSDANDIAITGATITAGAITATGQGDVTLTASGAIIDGVGKIAGDVLTATSVGSQVLDTTVASLVATTSATGFIEVTESDEITLSNMTTANGPISVTAGGATIIDTVISTTDADANDIRIVAATGDITVGTVNAGLNLGDVELTASAGAIVDDKADATTDITGDVLELIAAQGIGVTSTLDTAANSIRASVTGVGPVDLHEIDSVELTDVTTANGPVAIEAGADITVVAITSLEDIDANDTTLTSYAGSIYLGTIDVGVQGDVLLNALDGGIFWAGNVRADRLDMFAQSLQAIMDDIGPFPTGVANFTGSGTAGDDSIEIATGAIDTVLYTVLAPAAGTIDADGRVLVFHETELVEDTLIVQDRVFTFTDALQNDIDLADDGVAFNEMSRLVSLSTSLQIDFRNPVVTLLLNAGPLADSVVVDTLDELAGDGASFNAEVFVRGQDGNDHIDASASAFALVIEGNAGSDQIWGGSGSDLILGNDGDDFLYGNAGADIIFGDSGRLALNGASQLHTVRANWNLDLIESDATASGADTIEGNDGDDIIVGGLANDSVHGNAGNDIAIGDGATLTSVSNNGNGGFSVGSIATDLGAGVGGNDTIAGDEGNDLLLGGFGNDALSGNAGHDLIAGDNAKVDGIAFQPSLQIARIETTDLAAVLGVDLISGDDGDDLLFGGVDADVITGDNGNDIVVGDNGVVEGIAYDAAGLERIDSIVSEVSALGGADSINGNDGDDILIGGASGDLRLNGDSGNDYIIGDNGQLLDLQNESVWQLSTMQTTDLTAATGGADVIEGNDGDDIILGGISGDLIATGAGDHIVLGDNGRIDFVSGQLDRVESTETELGGADVISGDDGDDVVIAGFADDSVTLLGGDNIALGDSGELVFDTLGGSLAYVESIATDIGGNDTMVAGDDNDILVGGAADDTIDAGIGNNTIIGDNGRASFDLDGFFATLDRVETIAPQHGGGNDTITGSAGNNVVLGGLGDDHIEFADGVNAILGDNGQVEFVVDAVVEISSIDVELGGDDTIAVQAGINVVIGGLGSDTIAALAGRNVIFADHARANFAGGVEFLERIRSIASEFGGDDQITTGAGADILVGGNGADTISAGDGDHVVFGDHALVDYSIDGDLSTLDLVTSVDPVAGGGDDVLVGGTGRNIVLGGLGDDRIEWVGGINAIVGDNGWVDLVAGAVVEIKSIDVELGRDDTITVQTGINTLIGGAGADVLNAVGGANVIFGDNALASFAGGVEYLQWMRSLAPEIGGSDQMSSFAGADVIVAGNGADSITVGDGDYILLGDNGLVDYSIDGDLNTLDLATSIDPAAGGGDDVIHSGAGKNLIVGGLGAETVALSGGDNIVVGDNAELVFSNGLIDRIYSIEPELGGADVIITGAGNDIVLGGAKADSINAGDGANIVFGDNGDLDFEPSTRRLLSAASMAPAIGGDDALSAGAGADLLFGGIGSDTIDAGDGANVVLGDNGRLNHALDGDLDTLDAVVTTDSTLGGGDDVIASGMGRDILVGGLGSDTITAAGGDNLVLGDNADIVYTNGQLTLVESKESELGAGDVIVTGAGADVLFGGAGADSATAGAGNDVIVGDHGFLDTVINDGDSATIDIIQSTDPLLGGDDTVHAGAGDDIVLGGTGADELYGEAGYDILLGDHGLIDYDPTAEVFYQSIFATETDGGGNDSIDGGSEDDFVLGQQGDDTIFGGAGQDDLTGGHNVLFGSDGDDRIYGGDEPDAAASDLLDEAFATVGDGADVIVGDNGRIEREVLGLNLWVSYAAPFADVIRTVSLFDHIDFVAGDDALYGDSGQDLLYGQRGDDVLNGGSGDDELIGQLGDDAVAGGAGNDLLLGDAGQILRAFNEDGTPRVNSDGSWHRDVILTDVGVVTGVIDLDLTPLRSLDTELTAKLLEADLLLLGGVYLPDGAQLINGDSEAWATKLYLIDVVDAESDILRGGDGDDFLIGQRGDDELDGGSDDDALFGDGFTNTVPFESNLPQAVDGVRLIGQADGVGLALPEGGALVIPHLTLRPEEFTSFLPGLTYAPDPVPAFAQAVADEALVGDDGNAFVPYASIVSDIVHHIDMMPGNDNIDGGAGDDLIVGDNATVYAPLLTGLKEIVDASEDVTAEIFGLLRGLHFLSLDQQQLAYQRGRDTGSVELAFGNDALQGGAGEDTIIGDDAFFSTPFMVGLPVAEEVFEQAALDYQRYLFGLRRMVIDLSYVVAEAHVQVIDELVADLLLTNPAGDKIDKKNAVDPQIHTLTIGNDTIEGGADSDVLLGDDAWLLAPLVDGTDYKKAKDLDMVDKKVLKDTEKALKDADKVEKEALKDDIERQHADPSKRLAEKNVLEQLAWDWEYALTIGNDVIDGGAGDDLIVGDFALIVMPVVLDIPDNNKAAKDLQKDVDHLVKDLEHNFKHTHFPGYYHGLGNAKHDAVLGKYATQRGDKYAVGMVSAGNDVLSGGEGDDIVFADNLTLVADWSNDDWDASLLFKKITFDTRGVVKDLGFYLNSKEYRKYLSMVSSDIVDGGSGDDTLLGEDGVDTIDGGLGDDAIFGGKDKDVLSGGGGDDTIKKNGDAKLTQADGQAEAAAGAAADDKAKGKK
ncbi:MAG: Ca2+-binding RTX toxin-like protein, partial [Candidatus Latescibacterota bacterium]